MRESHVLRAVIEYLEWGRNQHRWWFMRVNSGTVFVPNSDGSKRRIQLAPTGTADVLVIRSAAKPTRGDTTDYGGWPVASPWTRVIWIETKHKGKQTESQKAFQCEVESQGCEYLICTDVDQVRERLER